MTDRYTLAEARAIIGDEKCQFEDTSYCYVHEGLNHGTGVCDAYPEVAIVAAQLLATVERLEALFSGGSDTPCRTTWPDGIECVEVPMADLRTAFNGEDVTE